MEAGVEAVVHAAMPTPTYDTLAQAVLDSSARHSEVLSAAQSLCSRDNGTRQGSSMIGLTELLRLMYPFFSIVFEQPPVLHVLRSNFPPAAVRPFLDQLTIDLGMYLKDAVWVPAALLLHVVELVSDDPARRVGTLNDDAKAAFVRHVAVACQAPDLDPCILTLLDVLAISVEACAALHVDRSVLARLVLFTVRGRESTFSERSQEVVRVLGQVVFMGGDQATRTLVARGLAAPAAGSVVALDLRRENPVDTNSVDHTLVATMMHVGNGLTRAVLREQVACGRPPRVGLVDAAVMLSPTTTPAGDGPPAETRRRVVQARPPVPKSDIHDLRAVKGRLSASELALAQAWLMVVPTFYATWASLHSVCQEADSDDSEDEQDASSEAKNLLMDICLDMSLTLCTLALVLGKTLGELGVRVPLDGDVSAACAASRVLLVSVMNFHFAPADAVRDALLG